MKHREFCDYDKGIVQSKSQWFSIFNEKQASQRAYGEHIYTLHIRRKPPFSIERRRTFGIAWWTRFCYSTKYAWHYFKLFHFLSFLIPLMKFLQTAFLLAIFYFFVFCILFIVHNEIFSLNDVCKRYKRSSKMKRENEKNKTKHLVDFQLSGFFGLLYAVTEWVMYLSCMYLQTLDEFRLVFIHLKPEI